jgi:hypothetical protein
MRDVYCCCPTLTKTGLCRQILTKHCNFQFNKNQLGGCRVVACGKGERRRDQVKTRGVFLHAFLAKGSKIHKF